MYINELSEPTLLVIYPGRFQPFHKGHKAVYDWLTGKFSGNNVYIATSNKIEGDRSPFTFAEKQYFMQLTGVPANRILQATQPYQITSIQNDSGLHISNPGNTVVIFAVSEKDMAEDPRFKTWTKKDGSPAYFQPLEDIKQTKNMNEHGYIMTVPTFDFSVAGDPMQSASELRAEYKVADEHKRQLIVKDLFGRYTREAEDIMNSKLAPVTEPATQKLPTKQVKLQKVKAPKDTQAELAECGGVGVVASKKQANDPRYSMSLTKDVRPGAIKKNLKAFSLAEQEMSNVDRLEQRRIEDINNLLDEIARRIATENLPKNYVEILKQKVEKLKAERLSYYVK